MNVEFSQVARRELQEAYDFHELQRERLGLQFFQELNAAVQRIVSFPEAWHPLSGSTRRCMLKRFPYALVYRLPPGRIIVVSVFNLHRGDAPWRAA